MEFCWKSKYLQMMCYYQKFKRVNTNTGSRLKLGMGKEVAEMFFSQCHHLKEWFKKDFPGQYEIEKYITESKGLSIAADYCNMHKHGGLDRPRRSIEKFVAINLHSKMLFTPEGTVCSEQVIITTENNKYDAFEIATECIQDWESFLESAGIPIPKP